MQFGDLAAYDKERLYIVLEGVLANIHTTEHKHGWKRAVHVINHVHWYEVPLKRLIVTKERYPHYELIVVTFLGNEIAEQAAAYLTAIGAPFDEMLSQDLDTFTSILPYQPKVRAVYDSDVERLAQYGQAGIAVIAGEDW